MFQESACDHSHARRRSGATHIVRAHVLGTVALVLLAACNRDPHRPQVQQELHAVQTSAASSAKDQVTEIMTTRNDYSAILPQGQTITIDNPYGDVHVRFGGYEHTIETHAVLQEPVGATHIALAPVTTSAGYVIAPRLPAGTTVREGQRLDLSIFVPENHSLTVRTEHGLIDVHGVHGDVDLKSTAGDIDLRGIRGAIHAETGEGTIEAALGTAPRNANQRLATTTGDLQVGVDDRLDAGVDMATSALFATDYSIRITRHPGEEPDKHASAVIGDNASKLILESRRGQIRLVRRAGFTMAGTSAAAPDPGDEDNDSD